MKYNRKKWKQIWKTKPQPKHHNTEDFMYYDMNEMEAWLWELIQHDKSFEKELREKLRQSEVFADFAKDELNNALQDGKIGVIKEILGEAMT